MFGNSFPGRPVSRQEITDYRLSDTLDEIEDLAHDSNIEQGNTNALLAATQKFRILQENNSALGWETDLLANLERQGTINDVQLDDNSASTLYGTLDGFLDGHIDSVERILKDAIARGTLDEATVSKAVTRWRRADDQLDEAQRAHQEREKKLGKALNEYNSATAEITRLFNEAAG